MQNSNNSDKWVWVIILNPEDDAQILGQQFKDSDEAFIPTFLEKDHALMCMNRFAKEKGQKSEAQAMLYDELVKYAAGNDFNLFILDGEGAVLEKILPATED